jgi:hypothetical protein
MCPGPRGGACGNSAHRGRPTALRAGLRTPGSGRTRCRSHSAGIRTRHRAPRPLCIPSRPPRSSPLCCHRDKRFKPSPFGARPRNPTLCTNDSRRIKCAPSSLEDGGEMKRQFDTQEAERTHELDHLLLQSSHSVLLLPGSRLIRPLHPRGPRSRRPCLGSSSRGK